MNPNEDWIVPIFKTSSAAETDALLEAELISVAGMLSRLHRTAIEPATEPITTPDLTTLKEMDEEHD